MMNEKYLRNLIHLHRCCPLKRFILNIVVSENLIRLVIDQKARKIYRLTAERRRTYRKKSQHSSFRGYPSLLLCYNFNFLNDTFFESKIVLVKLSQKKRIISLIWTPSNWLTGWRCGWCVIVTILSFRLTLQAFDRRRICEKNSKTPIWTNKYHAKKT